jgi:tripartite-type tricarboxylate transporter receptor subunit TctC
MKRYIAGIAAAAIAGAMAFITPAMAQNYPTRTIRLVVSFPPGGGIDAVARLFADKMSAILGQSVVVDNRGGASGLIAGRQVAAAEPDGYQVLVASNSMIIAQLLNASPGINVERDLRAVASVAPQASIIVAAPTLKASNMSELVALAKAKPLNYASPGVGSAPQLIFEHIFSTLAGAKMTHVPFPGAAAALTATMASQTEVAVVTLPPAVPLVNSSKIKGIAVTTAKRSAALPNVPTIAESGYPGIDSTVWTAFFVPTKTPEAVVKTLDDTIIKVSNMPEIKAQLAKLGFEPISISGEKFQKDVSAELKLWSNIIDKAGLRNK